MKTKLMRLMLAAVAIFTLGFAGANAGVLGKYNVKGTEGPYSFKGTLTLTSAKACVVRLRYSDGDSITVREKLRTALKMTKKKQTTRVTWSVYGMNGGGSLTVRGTKKRYYTSFSYSGYGISGRGTGTKKP